MKSDVNEQCYRIVLVLMKINTRKIALLTISIVTTLFTYRPIFQGKLLGDPFDSRLMLILHEHWWRWFNGLVAFRDTEFFYPYKTALGYSDVFFVQGIIYSIFRYLNFDMPNSWTITTFLLLIIGNLGWVFISLKYFRNYLIQFLFVLSINLSLSFVLYFSFNPNIVGYSFLSWIYLFYESILTEKNNYKKQLKIEIAIILYFVYALSCWYGAFFVAIIIAIKSILDLLKIKLENNNIQFKFIKKLNFKLFFITLPIQLFFIWLFYYVYIEVGDEPIRPTEEMIRNSPRLFLLPNGANINGEYLNGSVLKKIYIIFGLDKENEYTIGIGLIAFIFIIFILMHFILKDHKFFLRKTFPTSIIMSYLFFIVINNYSIHRIFFEFIPGFNSIRSPSRYVIFVGFFVIFGIYYFFDNVLNNTKKRYVKICIIILSLILLLDQYRAPFKGWEKSQLINTDLMSKKEEIMSQCDYFFYDKPGGWWYDQIEAMTFAIQIGIPTVNGYSGAFPPGYPFEPFNSTEQPNKIFAWIKNIDKNLNGCFIAGATSLKKLNTEQFSIDLVGFKSFDLNESSTIQWSTSPNPYLYVVDYSGKKIELNFELFPQKCIKNQNIRISLNGEIDLFQGEIYEQGKSFEFEIDSGKSIVNKLDIITKSEACFYNEHSEKLYFKIKNIDIN